MPQITRALVMEHAVFRALFVQIEHALLKATSAQEVILLASVVEGLLSGHGETESDLAYSALDHVLQEEERLNRLHQDHQEIDEHFKRVHQTNDLADARRLLKQALAATCEHFRLEEQIVFPFLERVLEPDTLAALGDLWLRRHSVSAQRAAVHRAAL